jgi:Asp-tRNA(Asn)/Glu-tRNA(Gln) amidotransferase A subunit family amidase
LEAVKIKSFLDISIKQIISELQTGHESIAEINDVCVKRFCEFEPKCKAWEVFDDESLLKQIRNCKPGPLHGIPIGVKDIFNTADFPTQMGSPLWKNFTPGNDARAVYNLKNAGAVIPGKTVTAEFAVHALGKTLNPHDVTRNPGTSSSGSAVAVASGMVPAAIGTQTAGSIVRPASYCGIYGCKPSFGLIPRTGMLKTCDTLDTVGFFTSHACDLRIMFDALRVHGRNYPVSHVAFSSRPAKLASEPWKIGFVRTNTWGHAEEYARDTICKWLWSTVQLGRDKLVQDSIYLPKIMFSTYDIHATIYNKSLSHYFREEYKNSQLVSPVMNDIIEKGHKIRFEQYMQALILQNDIIKSMDEFMQQYDILISLSTAGEAPLRDEPEKPDPALMWTLAHLPVISVPAFIGPNGLPFGMQIVARKYNDYLLFDFIDYLGEMELIPEGANPKIE